MKKLISTVLTLLMITTLAQPNICLANTNAKDFSQVKLTNKKIFLPIKLKKLLIKLLNALNVIY